MVGLRYLVDHGEWLIPEDELVHTAIENLRSMTAIGILEHYHETRPALEAAAGFLLLDRLPSDNSLEGLVQEHSAVERIPRHSQFDPAMERSIEKLIATDRRVYEWARDHALL